jgi:glyoxylase-like metal-dependent hydrolase (beta-lactamase superfamily II)/8-oxo-dGTP pyrophosphatase MutT (NUDIX family)
MSDTPTKNKRDAAAVLLHRGEGTDLEVLLVERAPELRFFGGYLALPGGVRGAEDGPDDLRTGDDTDALLSCALRELLEETGIAVGAGLRAACDGPARGLLRDRLLAEEPGAPAWAAVRTIRDLANGVRPICRICTPPFAPVRYDTVFFAAAAEPGDEPEIRPGELVGGQFWRPRDALAAWRRGELLIVPPVLILLECLLDGDVEAFAGRAAAIAARYAAGALHRVRFSPGVLMASVRTPTLPPATTTNCLLIGHGRLYVLDPATPYADEQLRLFALLDEVRDEGAELAGILVTHHHPDHVGAVTETSRRYGLPVHAHPLTLERLAPGFVRGRALEDGDRIELGTAPDGSTGWELVAVHTPGHDRGHLCFRESRYQALVAGDMLSTVSTIVVDPPEGHLATYLRSLERLLEEPVGTLYPAHGPAIRDGQRLVRQYLRHRAQRESALLKALAEAGPVTAAALVPRVYWETDPRMHALAERSLIAGLDKLREEGLAVCDGERWRLGGS